MKARVKETGEIVDILVCLDGRFSTIPDGWIFDKDELDFNVESNSVEIEGWVAVDEYGMGGTFLHTSKPTAVDREFCDTGEFEVYWESDGTKYELDSKLFPDMTSESSPRKVRITITPIEE